MHVAYVTPRYGREVVGGAELGVRMFAERLVEHLGWRVDVLTTCATDLRTWANELPAGERVEDGVRVHRFPTACPRLPDFDERSGPLLARPGRVSADDARKWIRWQGPHSPALLDALQLPPSLVPPAVVDGFVVVEPAGGDGIALPVVLAGADTQCALLGMGAFAPGDAGVAAGWSAPVQLVTANATLDPLMRTWAGVHVVPDRWVIESNAGETGRAWDWACGLLAQTPNAADALAIAVCHAHHRGSLVTAAKLKMAVR